MPHRTLLLLRHAKSAYPDGVEDHDRPLSERGERDAKALGELLGDPWPDLVLCSTALRARQTWELLESAARVTTTVRYERELFGAGARAMLGLIRGTGDDVQRLLVVGHNPGTQDLAVELAGKGRSSARKRLTEKYPTAGLAELALDGSWRDAAAGAAELVRFAAPRG